MNDGKYGDVSIKGYDALKRRLVAVGKVDQQYLKLLAYAANREQKQLLYTEAVHRKTGHSGQLVTVGVVTENNAELIASGTAAFADTGTRPHDITPNAKKALRWATSSSKGFRLTGMPRAGSQVGYRFATVVHHPGTKAHHYMLKGAQKAVAAAGVEPFVAAWNRAS